MRDLSVFAEHAFDLILHSISNLCVPDVRPVWRECHRVLRTGGALAGEALVFGHTLTGLIAGQLDAGFAMTGFYEDFQPQPRFLVDRYLPTFLATRALKR